MDHNKKAKFALWMGIVDLVVGGFMLALVSGEKDTWEYYFSSSRRSQIDMVTVIGWLFLAAGAFELIYAFIVNSTAGQSAAGSAAEPEEREEVIEWIEGEIVEKGWDPKMNNTESIVVKQKNGITLTLRHYIGDDQIYRVGDKGLFRAQQRMITEFISSDHVL